MPDRTLSDSQLLIDEHGDHLYRFALVRVRDPHVAEDLVQDTFLAALQGTYRESGPSAERKWMIGIMKHKIVDSFRRTTREPIQGSDRSDDQSVEDAFLPDGHWTPNATVALSWPDNPDGVLERRQFWDTLTTCLEKLPPRAAQVFALREVDEVETDEICRLLRLTPNNLGVILHRARKQLRDCLASRYFGQTQEVVKP